LSYFFADVSFVRFYGARERFFVGGFDQSRSLADAVIQVPRGLAASLMSRRNCRELDSFFRVHHQDDRQEPLIQTQMRIAEDRRSPTENRFLQSRLTYRMRAGTRFSSSWPVFAFKRFWVLSFLTYFDYQVHFLLPLRVVGLPLIVVK
jgi:hypothetical protein